MNVKDDLKIILDSYDCNNLEIAIGDTPHSNKYKRRFVKVIEIINNYSFKMSIELSKCVNWKKGYTVT